MLWNTSSTAEADVGLRLVASLVLAVTAALAATHNATAGGKTPAGSAFTYQGRLTQAGEAVTGSADMQFTLWNGPSEEAAQVGPMLVVDDLDLVDGLFTVDLDFGPDAFNGTGRWLEVAVRVPHDPTDTQPFESLSPRQPMMAAPYALHALGIGTVADSSLDGTYTGELSFTNAANNFAGSFTGAGGGLTGLNASNITFGNLSSALLPAWGEWSLLSKLIIDVNTLAIDPDSNRVGIGTAFPSAQLGLGSYSSVGSPVSEYDKQVVLGGTGNDPWNSGNSVKLLISEYDNGAFDDTYPIYVEDHSNIADFFIRNYQGNSDLGFRMAYFGGSVGVGALNPERRLHVVGDGGNNLNGIRITHPDVNNENSNDWDLVIGGSNNSFPGGFAIAREGGAKLTITSSDKVGIGTATPVTKLHVRGNVPNGHMALFENTSEESGAGGIVVKLGNPDTDTFNNFITFRNGDDEVTGRIEGFGLKDTLDPPFPSIGLPSVDVPFDPGWISFDEGSLPFLSINFSNFTYDWSPGSLPSVDYAPPNVGTPLINWPVPTNQEIQDLTCWAYETGFPDFITLDPVSAAVTAAKITASEFCRKGGVVYGSKGADYAEWMPKFDPAQRFQFGQIVGIHGGKVSLDTEGADQIMAVSVNPVVLGNIPDDADKPDMVPVSFMGQVPVTVRGEVRAGDYIIPSGFNDGTAIAVAPEYLTVDHLDQVLGRAWSDSDNSIISIITVSIGVNTYDAARVLRQQDQRIEELLNASLELVDRLAALEARLTDLEATAR